MRAEVRVRREREGVGWESGGGYGRMEEGEKGTGGGGVKGKGEEGNEGRENDGDTM